MGKLQDAVAQDRQAITGDGLCQLIRVVNIKFTTIDIDDREWLIEQIDPGRPKYSCSGRALARALTVILGEKIREGTVSVHRRGDCACRKAPPWAI